MDKQIVYKNHIITREDNGDAKPNWEAGVMGTRRNFETLREAKRYIDMHLPDCTIRRQGVCTNHK